MNDLFVVTVHSQSGKVRSRFLCRTHYRDIFGWHNDTPDSDLAPPTASDKKPSCWACCKQYELFEPPRCNNPLHRF